MNHYLLFRVRSWNKGLSIFLFTKKAASTLLLRTSPYHLTEFQDGLLRNIINPRITDDIMSYPVRISFAVFGSDTLFVTPNERTGAAAHVDVPGSVINAATHGYVLTKRHDMNQLRINETLQKQVQMAFSESEVTCQLYHGDIPDQNMIIRCRTMIWSSNNSVKNCTVPQFIIPVDWNDDLNPDKTVHRIESYGNSTRYGLHCSGQWYYSA